MAEYLTLEEAADQLGVEYKTLYRLVRSGDLPAGKIGRIYRIRKEDLESYFDQQKDSVVAQAKRTGLMALERVSCCACGKPILSELSIGGRCEQTGKEICQACWSIRKIHRCPREIKAVEPAEVTPNRKSAAAGSSAIQPENGTPSVLEVIAQLRSQGKPVVTSEDAGLLEESFLRSFGQRLEEIEELPDPLTGRTIQLRKARVKHEIGASEFAGGKFHGSRVSRFALKTGGWGKPSANLVLEGHFLCRLESLGTCSYDAEPIGEAELALILNGLCAGAKKVGVFHVVLLGSPTGWTEQAVSLIIKARSSQAFRDRRVAVVLRDIHTDAAYMDASDERLWPFWSLVAPAEFASKVSQCIQAIQEVLARKNSLTRKDAVKTCKAAESWVRAAFDELSRSGDYTIDLVPELGPVISRQTS